MKDSGKVVDINFNIEPKGAERTMKVDKMVKWKEVMERIWERSTVLNGKTNKID